MSIFDTQQDKQTNKGKIEISVFDRDMFGNPTNRKRNFASNNGQDVSQFWNENRPIKKQDTKGPR